MRKTTLVINDEILAQARAILGTHGLKDTIDRALEQVVIQDSRRALLSRLAALEGLDLADDEVMRQAWRD